MRVLWVCNIMLPQIAQALGVASEPVGGWMTGLLDAMDQLPGVEIGVAYPSCAEKAVQGTAGNVAYYSFCQPSPVMLRYDTQVEHRLKTIIEEFRPDLLHIFGTEYMHTLAAVRAFQCPQRTLIGIQGLLTFYARHFMAGLPGWVQRGCTFRDLVKRDNLIQQRKSFYIRAAFEQEAIRNAAHVIGRTDWDQACTQQIHPQVRYHFCNEILRGSFYEARWSLENCERHSIFVSQGSYPIKGLHCLLEAFPKIRERYPDARIYVAGGDITKRDTRSDRLRMSSYGKYICKLLKELELKEAVSFTGFLDETAMRARFLKAHVFVSPSSIENSPNSVGEAMLLGMPVVASDVGGIKNMLAHGKEGYVYQADASYMISYYVNEIFKADEQAVRLGQAAAEHASQTHNREEISRRLLQIYEEVNELCIKAR